MSIMVKYGNSPTSPLYESDKQYVKINGIWKPISSAYIKMNDAWKAVPLAVSRGYEIITTTKQWTCPANVYTVDIFLVGGGYNGGACATHNQPYTYVIVEGKGGDGGKTLTVKGIPVIPGKQYTITIGAANGGISSALGYYSKDGLNVAGGTATISYVRSLNSTPYINSNLTNSTAGNDGVYPFGDASFISTKYGASGASGGVYNCFNNDTVIAQYGNYGGSYGGGSACGGKGADGYGAGGGGAAITTDGFTNISNPRGTSVGTGGTGCVIIRWGY